MLLFLVVLVVAPGLAQDIERDSSFGIGSNLPAQVEGTTSLGLPVPPAPSPGSVLPLPSGAGFQGGGAATSTGMPELINASANDRVNEGLYDESLFGNGIDDSDLRQKVDGNIDRRLERFGYRFFSKSSAFEPDQGAPVGPDYIIGPGDALKIDIWGNVEGNYVVSVDRNGEIVLPKVGVINLWGQTFAQAKETIRKQVAKYFSQFEINVTMGGLRSIQIFVVGEVHSPGTYTVSSLSTVLTALATGGGPTGTGSLRRVQLRRSGQTVGTIDFYGFLLHGDRSQDLRLQSGDTIFVPVVGPLVGVAGNVQRPAIYELNGEQSLQHVLELAGGIIPTAYLQKVQIERVESHRKRTVLDLDLGREIDSRSAAAQFRLQDRDLVNVAPISDVSGYVQLEGYVRRPGQYQLVAGMRLADLILPYDNLLPEFYPGMVQIVRMLPPAYSPEIITVDLGKALAGDPHQNLLLMEYDRVRLFSTEEMDEIPEVVVNGAVLKPGTYRLFDNMSVKDLIGVAGNLKRRAYLAEAEITRYIPSGKETRTERILIDLEKALAGDPQSNLQLQQDDHLFVRSIPDYGDRLSVTVAGEVVFPGTYAITRGETLTSLLQRAGGFTSEAYLRGAVFTRESLKGVQRQRLEKLMFEQEQEIYRLSSDLAQGAMSTEDTAAAQAVLEGRKQLLLKLKQAPVTGRMVARLAPLSELASTAGDFELMDGDSLIVPKNPQSVTVLGEVYNPVSIVYLPGQSVSYYLSKVGGPTKNANEDEMFIIRADGTVFSKDQAGMGMKWDTENWRWVFGGFNVSELYPGDTVLVPEKIKQPEIMKDVKDISTIIYQMALGAAAVASF